MIRTELELLPDFSAELEEIRKNGISKDLLYKIIQKHRPNSDYNKSLYKRYKAIYGGVPIFSREPRFEEENPLNNRVNNDFFSEIVDFKVGYFAGKPIAYSYSKTQEAQETTSNEKIVDEEIKDSINDKNAVADGENAIEEASKTLTDFITRNNMFGVDMEVTKNASIYGYSGRLFYIDTEGMERVMPIHGYETIILSDTDISEPEYAIRYYEVQDINQVVKTVVEFYDDRTVTTYKGDIYALEQIEVKPHLFDYCPLQGVSNNRECLGDAEKVLTLIDDYDKVVSDNSNEVEAFVHAYLIFEGLRIDEDTIKEGQKNGSFVFPASGTQQGRAYFLTKNINDAFTEHHLMRTEDNIYRFSKTPNLKDSTFGTASGVSLKFKLHGLETKCGMYQAQMMNAAQYMWRLLASAWRKKGTKIDPLQIVMEFKRNFPLDSLSEAQTAQAQIGAGLPKRWVYSQMSSVDDVDYIMQLIEEEKTDATSLYENDNDEDDEIEDVGINDKNMYKVTSILGQLKRGQITRSVAQRALVGLGFTNKNAETLVDENDQEKESTKGQNENIEIPVTTV